MSSFLSNVVAKSQGEVARLVPRRPSPYEFSTQQTSENDIESLSSNYDNEALRHEIPVSDSQYLGNTQQESSASMPTTDLYGSQGIDDSPVATVIEPTQRSTRPSDTLHASSAHASNVHSSSDHSNSAATGRSTPSAVPSNAAVASGASVATSVSQPQVARRATLGASNATSLPTVSHSLAATAPSAVAASNPATPAKPVTQVSHTQPSESPTIAEAKPATTHAQVAVHEPTHPANLLNKPVAKSVLTPTDFAVRERNTVSGSRSDTTIAQPESSVVEVHIGTIEVTAPQPPVAAPVPAGQVVTQEISLDDFLSSGNTT